MAVLPPDRFDAVLIGHVGSAMTVLHWPIIATEIASALLVCLQHGVSREAGYA